MRFLKKFIQYPKYVKYLVLCQSARQNLWDFDVFQHKVVPHLDVFISNAKGKPSVHCRQVTKKGSKGVKFGKLSWHIDSHKKWCHESVLTENKSVGWLFVDMEIFAPAKPKLIEADEYPDLYVQLSPLPYLETEDKRLYDQVLLIVLKNAYYNAHQRAFDEEIKAIDCDLGAQAVYRSSSRFFSLNQFESIVREDFIYRNMPLDRLPDTNMMKGKWEPVGSLPEGRHEE